VILALVKKEIRQNLFIAVPGMFVVFLAFCHVLTSGGLDSWVLPLRTHDPDPMPLLSSRELAVAAAYCLLGVVLGLVSPLFEAASEKNTWPLLLRLPISRGKILFGKALGGAASYLIAGVPPLVFAVIWVAIPGHYPGPFRIGMAAPAVVDLLLGLVGYSFALALGVRARKETAVGRAGAALGAAGWVFFVVAALPAVGAGMFVYLAVNSFLAAVLIEFAVMLIYYWAAYSFFARREF
jgi:hypothetical protein